MSLNLDNLLDTDCLTPLSNAELEDLLSIKFPMMEQTLDTF